MANSKKSTVKNILMHIGHYRFLLLFSILLASGVVAGTLYIPILIGQAIDCIVGKGAVDFKGITAILIKVGVLSAAVALLQWIMNTLNNRITFCVVRDVRNEAFAKLQTLPLKYLDTHPTGETLNRIIADADQFADGLLLGFTQLFTGVATIIGTLIFMLYLKPSIALVVVLLTPLSLFVAKFIASKTYNLFKEQSKTRAEQTAFIDETVGNMKVVSAFSREEKSLEEFEEINERLKKCSLKATFFSSLTNPCTRFINSVVYAAVALTGALMAPTGITVGGLSSFLAYANQYTKPFNEISGVVTELQNALACAGRLFELIYEESETADSEHTTVIENVDGDITLENVYFSYTQDRPLIQNFNLTVKSGQRVAIVGPTGCGKTTLINLLMRFYDVNSGSIKIEGTDIRSVSRHSLRKNYGMVLQETWLCRGTIRDNIAFGNPNATKEEVINAAKAAHAHSFIKRLPNGYDTVIGEEGGNLSAGQKQLLCIARIMLCLPPMLILDEATSSIDTRTEMRIQKAFTTLMKGRTSFIVAHRLSTVREADIILVMKDGNVIEQGRHEDLLKMGGFYSTLYNSQFAVQ